MDIEYFHVHSYYSSALIQPDSTMSIKDYAKEYRERGNRVLCISEHGNRSNVWEQFDICEDFKKDGYEMTPLAAAETYFVPDRLAEVDGKKDGRNFHLILVAKDMEGFYQLNEALSEANLTGFYKRARVDFDILGKLDYKHFLCSTACFVKGTKVETISGKKNIEDITPNDYILNRYGVWEKVNYPTHRYYNGIGCEVLLRGERYPIRCTANHKFLATTANALNCYKRSGKDPLKWVEAIDLTDYKSESNKYILLQPIVNKIYSNRRTEILKTEWKNKLVKRDYHVKKPLKDRIELSPEIMRFFGLWLGNGSISINHNTNYYTAGITFDDRTFDIYWNDFVENASNQIGVEWSISRRPEQHRVDIASHSIEFVEMMHYLFGNSKANTKSIPDKLLNISKELNLNLLFGLILSDGSIRDTMRQGYQCGQMVFASISLRLVQQVKEIFEENYIQSGAIREVKESIDKCGVHHRESYYLTIANKAFAKTKKTDHFENSTVVDLFKEMTDNCNAYCCEINGIKYKKKYIKSISNFELCEEVYCLNVNTHSFVCEDVVVHNCVAGITSDPNYDRLACQLHEIFKENFYLEIQPHPQKIQVETNMKILRLYGKYHWPLIVATDSHYIKPEDAALRKELLLSSKITYGDEDEFVLDLPTAEEVYNRLDRQGVFVKARIEEAMENTLILREFEGVHFTKEKKIPNAHHDIPVDRRNYMYKKEVCDGYIQRAGMPTKEEAAELHAEMDTITSTGTADYFLIMKEIVDKGKEYGGVLTTTGRGSGASYASNFSLGFSSINRLRCPVKMLPERFISADRLKGSLPDLDLNMANVPAFERAGKEILGEYGCLPMIAYGTVKTLSAFKLLARARDLDFTVQNEVSKQIQNYELDVKHAIENNSDDPDYNVDDDINIDSYVDEQYLDLINESKQYKGIVLNISPHPCAHILLDKDLRRETGVIRVKSKSGNKDAVIAAYIDGKTADAYNYLKADYLRVDVVKIIDAAFHQAGLSVMTVDELLAAVKDDKEVWKLYANGYTQGLNQCERDASTKKCMQYKPKNVEELCAFVAGIRPGFKSMINTFLARDRFSYGIPSLDKLLQTEAIPDSFLEFDEQILVILKAAGIPGPEAYATIKAIKKKKTEKVLAEKEKFKTGFTKVLQETEGASEEKAHEVVEKIWTIIENAANYMFQQGTFTEQFVSKNTVNQQMLGVA